VVQFSCVVGLPLANYAKFYSIITACATSAVLTVGVHRKALRANEESRRKLFLELERLFAMAAATTGAAALFYLDVLFLSYPSPFFTPQAYVYAWVEEVLAAAVLYFVWLFYTDALGLNRSTTRRGRTTYWGVQLLILGNVATTMLAPVFLSETVTGVVNFNTPLPLAAFYAVLFFTVNLTVAVRFLQTFRLRSTKPALYMGLGALLISVNLLFNVVSMFTYDAVSAALVWLLIAAGLILIYVSLFRPKT